jgi:hypothetical protein
MPQQDTSGIKDKILSTLRLKGPSLPVPISKEIEMSPLFASAFLSELLSEKKLKISHMKIGSSPAYFIPGQEPQLEKYSQHLKSREKDAFELLKQEKILQDTKQLPAIRVALRSIRDFAIPFKKEGEIFWRYLTTPEPKTIQISKPLPRPTPTLKPLISQEQKEEQKDKVGIFKKIENKITPKKRKPSNKGNEKFFNQVKDFLKEKHLDILDIEGFSKSDLTFKVRKNGKEHLLIAYNKRRIADTDLIKAYKKATEKNLPYIILSKGEPTKKLGELIQASKDLTNLERMD